MGTTESTTEITFINGHWIFKSVSRKLPPFNISALFAPQSYVEMISELQNVKLLSLHQFMIKTLIKTVTASCSKHRGFWLIFLFYPRTKNGNFDIVTESPQIRHKRPINKSQLMPFLQGLTCLLAGVGRHWAYSFALMDYLRGHGPHLGPVTRNLQHGASTRGKHSLTFSTHLAFGHLSMLAFKTRLNSTRSS